VASYFESPCLLLTQAHEGDFLRANLLSLFLATLNPGDRCFDWPEKLFGEVHGARSFSSNKQCQRQPLASAAIARTVSKKKEEAAVVFDASCFVPSFWKSQILTVTNICELV
jgi:hypothetical protein